MIIGAGKKKAQTMRSGPVNPPFEEVEETTSAKIQRVGKDGVLMRWVQYIGADAAPHHELWRKSHNYRL
jgi:hypothetical protein